MLTDNGLVKERNGYKKLHGILDVGFRTTDFLIFENGQFIGEKEELSEDTGIRIVLEKIQSYIKKKFDKEEIEFIEPVMRGKLFEFRGEEHDLTNTVAQLISDHINKRIEPEVLKRWEGRINRMNKIIICGGGAYFFKDINDFLKEHRKQIFIPAEATAAHLWFEEVLSGDTSVDFQTVWQYLEEAMWYLRAMLVGGHNFERTFSPLTDAKLRQQIRDVQKKLEKLEGKKQSKSNSLV